MKPNFNNRKNQPEDIHPAIALFAVAILIIIFGVVENMH